MKSRSRCLTLVAATLVLGCTTVVHAEAAPATTSAASAIAAGPLDQHTLDKRTQAVLKPLKLTDASREAAVRAASETFFQALETWHRQVDPQLKTLWAAWSAARSPAQKDEAKAAEIAGQIDAVYAQFRPQHDAFLQRLAGVLTPEQIETVKNALTSTPGFKRTYEAYLQIVPNMNNAQKAFIRDRLLAAREEAMDTTAKKEKIDLFKKEKVKVQAYIDEQGYNWDQSYKEFVAKLKAQSKAKKSK